MLTLRTRRASLVLASLLASGCEASDGPANGKATPRASHGKVSPGTIGVTEHYEMTASVPDECSGASARAEGLIRLGIEVTLSARGAVQVPANPYYALLVDSDRRVFEATLGGCEPGLRPTLLEGGQSARGFVVFEVPERSRGFELVYAPRLSTTEPAPASAASEAASARGDVIDELVFALGR